MSPSQLSPRPVEAVEATQPIQHSPESGPQPQPPKAMSTNDDALKRALSARTAPSVAGHGTGQSIKRTLSRAASHLQAAHGIKDPWGLKWRSHPVFLTGVVLVGVCSDILAYTIVVPVLPYRLQELGYTNIAALTSWLLFAYSAGIFVGTFPTAWFFHRYPVRRGPLVAAVLIMIGSCILFMIPNNYTAMVISRVIQGMSSCIVWTVGFALICENIDPAHLGTHLGFAFTGISIGATIAPPIGGALYKHMGWHAPFIFLIIILSIDTIARLFIIERKDVIKLRARQAAHAAEMAALNGAEPASADSDEMPRTQCTTDTTLEVVESPSGTVREKSQPVVEVEKKEIVELSPWGVLKALVSLPRGVVAFCLFFVFGFIIGALDATLTIRVETIWHKDSDFVGIIYLCGAAPAFFTGPLAGWLSDKYGTEWVIGGTLLLCLPWIPLMILTNSLPGFIVYFAFTNIVATSLNAVASLEVAIVSKFRDGISEIHEFAAMNLAFAVSSAIGAIVGGQIYDSLSNGWDVICWICFACFVVMVAPPLLWTGSWPLFWRVIRRPGPRSGIHPDELAKRDAEKAAKDAEMMAARDVEAAAEGVAEGVADADREVAEREAKRLSNVPGQAEGVEEVEMGVTHRATSRVSDIPPLLPPTDGGHSASPKIPQS